MEEQNIIKGHTEDEIWQQINTQLTKDPELLYYNAIVMHGSKKIELTVDIDLGGGFESGYETTTITAPLNKTPPFKFAIHQEHFTDEIGKFFGMQDVVIGYEDFDKRFIIKTNDEVKIKNLFADETIRTSLMDNADFSLGITHHNSNNGSDTYFLEFLSETGITDPAELRRIYSTFYRLLQQIDDKELV